MFSSASSNLVTWENMTQEPSSPTLTNPDLILPDLSDSLDSTPSPQLHPTRPPSPPAHLLRESFRLPKPSSSPGVKPLPSRPPTSYTNNSFGASTDDGDTTPQRLVRREHDMESSTSLRATPRANVMQAWQRDGKDEANDRLDHWPGFDGPNLESDADSHFSTDDATSRLGSLPYVAGSDEETDPELFNDGHEELDLEAISSAALSKRAEMILANAKKRLNLMEGNLRGARQSLVPPPRPKYNSYTPSKRPVSISPMSKGSGPFYIPQPQHAALASPSLRSSATTPGHTRGHSEVSDLSLENSTTPRRAQRAVSAMGSFRMQWPQSGTNTRNSMISLRGARSQETIRHTWVSGEQPSYRSMSRGSMHQISPTLETLKEDEATQQRPTLHRSASTTSELRSQMQNLNRRISTLREKAREEHLKRRSLQSLRDPEENGYHWDAEDEGHSQAGDHSKNGKYAPRASTAMELRRRRNSSQQSDYDSRFEDADEEFDYDQRSPHAVKPHGNHHSQEDREINGDDQFEDAEQVLSERHEDRLDAFDYENFFLHSAMGTYRAEQRSNSVSSVSSEDSVETTRPTSRHAAAAAAAAARANARKSPKLGRLAVPNHHRQKSADSISSITTFQTATEGRDPGSDADIEPSEDDEQGDEEVIDRHIARSAAHTLAFSSKKSNQSLSSSASESRHLHSAASSLSPHHLNSSGSSFNGSSPLIQSPPSEAYFSSGSGHGSDTTARIMATFFAQSNSRDKLTPLAQKDEDLLYALTTSIQQVCARLQSAQEDAYETKIWRRRLDAARKILDGVPEEIQM
ncbi:hypothetical protein IWZ01DRAFT_539481 [Phyllosticta capitalensis]